MRLSSYSVLSAPLDGGGFALLNGATGAVDFISEELAQIITEALSHSEPHSAQIPEHAIHPVTLSDFLERGHFTAESHETERAHVATIAAILHEEEKKNPRFLFVPNMDCNYRCTYCFERPLQNVLHEATEEGSLQGNSVVMSPSHVEMVYKGIEIIQSAAGRDGGGQIVLYGGEPLDADNKDVVFKIINHKNARKYDFAAITNGHDLNHFSSVLGKGKIGAIQVTIDGPKHIHDKKRISRKGDSSFDRIMSNVRAVLQRGDTKVDIRVHIDATNIAYFKDLLDIFLAENWLDQPAVTIYANIIYRKNSKGTVSSTSNIEHVLKRLQRYASPYKNVFIAAIFVNAYDLLSGSLRAGQPYRMRGAYCAANTGMYIFLPDGTIHSCWESIGKDCSRIGTYMNGLNLDRTATEKWFSRSVNKIAECLDCSFCLVCGGGCSQYAEYNSDDMLKPFCDDFQKIFPGVLARAVDDFISRSEYAT